MGTSQHRRVRYSEYTWTFSLSMFLVVGIALGVHPASESAGTSPEKPTQEQVTEQAYVAGKTSIDEVLAARLKSFKAELKRARSPDERIAILKRRVQDLRRVRDLERSQRAAGLDRSKRLPPAAEAALHRATTQLAGLRAAKAHRWQTLKPTRLELPNGERARTLPDASVLFHSPGPKGSESRLVFSPGRRRITHLRFEALNHKSLPGTGPGRAADGSLLLFALELYHVSPARPTFAKYLEVKTAWADQQDEHRTILDAVDFISDTSWIAPSPDHPHAPVTAVLELAQPVYLGPNDTLAVKIDAGHNDHRTPGRVRISVANSVNRAKPPRRNNVLFEDNFDNGLSAQWKLVGLRKEDYRIQDGGLELRVQPGKGGRRTPMLSVVLPFTASDTVSASVDVAVLTRFTQPKEFAALCLIEEGPEFSARKQLIQGKLVFSPAKYTFVGKPGEEGDPKNYSVKYTEATNDAGPLRIIADRGTAFFQVGPSSNGRYLNFFRSAIRKKTKQRGFCLMAAGAPNGAAHWVRFDNFRVVKD